MLVIWILFIQTDTPSITAKLINEQKEDKEKKNHEEKEKMKADSGFQDNYSVVVASGAYSYMNSMLIRELCRLLTHKYKTLKYSECYLKVIVMLFKRKNVFQNKFYRTVCADAAQINHVKFAISGLFLKRVINARC